MAKNKDCVSITRDEYEELIECKTKINLLIEYAISMERMYISKTGLEAVAYDAKMIHNFLGSDYINSCISSFKRKWKEKKVGREKCE